MTKTDSTMYHLRPETGGWLNDPNGMTKVGDTWHVFYQHNPLGPWHESITWGHASSTDLANWKHHPIAFSPTPGGPDEHGCWSGCFVPGGDQPIVAYSGVTDESLQSTVCLRYGSEDLITWGDPLVVADTPDADGIAVMRDPFVFELDGTRWAVLGGGLQDGTPVVLLFEREEETAWNYAGVFASGTDEALASIDRADIWECPQLFQVDDRWVLILSLQYEQQFGRVIAVTGSLELIDGRPCFVPSTMNALDNGNCFYAPQVVNVDGSPLLFGWVRETDQDPAVVDHAGCLTLPRRLSLQDGLVVSAVDPIAAEALVGASQSVEAGTLNLGGRHARFTISGEGALLQNPMFGEVSVPEDAEIWVDGPMLELHPKNGIPATWRSEAPWDFHIPAGISVTVREVGLSIL